MKLLNKEEKLKIESPVKRKSSVKRPKPDDKSKTALNDSNVEKKPHTIKKIVEEEEIREIKSEKEVIESSSTSCVNTASSEPVLELKEVSAMVVAELTPVYKTGAFLNKELFKKLAKKLSHFILYRNFASSNSALDEIRARVSRLASNRHIHAESDYEHVFD